MWATKVGKLPNWKQTQEQHSIAQLCANKIFKSVDSYLDDIKNAGTQYEKKIVHPNILLYCIIRACVIGLLFFVFKIFCTSTHSRKLLFPSCRMREWTNRNNYLAPLGTRSVSLNGINQPATSIEMTPITAMPNIPTFHYV